ncbi:lysine N(6)-hydroxylase/L-ornithine N(5)-oxygenase family protein [Kribbella sp. VKM Ac-2566]|uniref:lysine N(6)-hydroxylase/L-ornithine N(5)-oxygenase family protein n=1 Tax=Kribbella sp. VKM Ac-2566 TaxID=2512218 RepID=UPI001063564A|nr:SidA/IucD/PvdA family monooxygenase [Kribbella sp. VKM Ac-2566]TDW86183.1 lysine N6-hydroxylase [Kribbella sp. VKM Ac-2566]
MYDVIAIGCGPFNLGLAALADGVDDVQLAVLDSRPEFTWHRGLMFEDAMLQVSFLADLVSLVEPAHHLSFLSYLRDNDRLYQFYVREKFHPTRREYETYLRWCAAQLDSLHFGHHVQDVEWNGSSFELTVERGDSVEQFEARHLVVGVGTEPFVPAALAGLPAERFTHSADYLFRREDLLRTGRVTVVGSGQSGAECALDLLRANGPAVSWLTRTPSFAPLDYSKLVLEMTTPSYVDYFHGLDEPVRDKLVKEQWRHYKGISSETLDDIHDVLYSRDLPVELQCGVAVVSAVARADGLELTMLHADSGKTFQHLTGAVVAATGYRNRPLPFLESLQSQIEHDAAGRWVINRDHSVRGALEGRIFVANADLHSHGVAAPDLGIGAIRNATILNSVAGREVFRLPKSTAYTTFAIPG